MRKKEFEPRFYQANILVMKCDDCEEFGTDAVERIGIPEDMVGVFLDYSVPIGMAKLTLDRDSRQVFAEVYLDALPPRGWYPALQGRPSDFYEGDRVIAVGDEGHEDVMIAEMPEDKILNFVAMAFTPVQPVDTRIKPFDLDACSDIGASQND